MVSSSFYAKHYEEESSRASHTLAGRRTVVPRERRFVDPLGGVTLAGGPLKGEEERAWQGMTSCCPPREKQAPQRKTTVPCVQQIAPRTFNAEVEEAGRKAKALAADRWETGVCGTLPALPDDMLVATKRRPQAPRKGGPFATMDGPRFDDVAPRGRRRYEVVSSSEREKFSTGRRSVACRAASSALKGSYETGASSSDRPGLLVAHGGHHSDSFCIGNPRAENFVIRDRPHKYVDPKKRSETAMAMALVMGRTTTDNIERRKPSRRAFPDQTGGGLSHLGHDGSYAPSALEREERTGRRLLQREVKETPTPRPGRRQYYDNNTTRRPEEEKESSVASLEKFASWYRSHYDEEPPRAALEHAAQHIVEDQQESASSRNKKAPLVAEDTNNKDDSEFVRWYQAKYQSPPPPKLVHRAAKAFAMGDKDTTRGPLHHELSPQKSRGPRPSALGDPKAPGKNNILGRSSTRVDHPPGGHSSLSLAWDS